MTRLSRLAGAVSALAAVLGSSGAASAVPSMPITVALHQASGRPLSYFDLNVRAGHRAPAGTLQVSNRSARQVTVVLDPVGGLTVSTLGSGYQTRGTTLHGPASWTSLNRRRIVLPPYRTAKLAVATLPPAGTPPGEYLSGIGVQELNPPAVARPGSKLQISSVERYAIGVEVRIPGPRHPLIKFTGAAVHRAPSGLMFYLYARNEGNMILQNVHGTVLITRGTRVVEKLPLGPGTFVTGTSIAYPLAAISQLPPQGAVYRIRASMHYAGGVAYLDSKVRFGRADALRQQAYGGPKAPPRAAGGPTSSPIMLLATGAGALLLLLLVGILLRARRRWQHREISPLKTLDETMRAARERGEPLSLITLTMEDASAVHKLEPVLRARLRPSDRLCRINGHGLLIVAPDTGARTVGFLAGDLRRHVDRISDGSGRVVMAVHALDGETTADQVLQRLEDTDGNVTRLTPYR